MRYKSLQHEPSAIVLTKTIIIIMIMILILITTMIMILITMAVTVTTMTMTVTRAPHVNSMAPKLRILYFDLDDFLGFEVSPLLP